jgi:beta-aspartyl-peptidase (threonine type)
MSKIAIAIHGGAGTILKSRLSSDIEQLYNSELQQALHVGYDVLLKGGSSVDAVEGAVRYLEDCPLFNAGRGSVFNNLGNHEMDASIMDGRTLKAGAVAGVSNIKNPVSLARQVMDRTKHVFLVSEGANQFGKLIGSETRDDSYFYTDERHHQWQRLKNSTKCQLDHDHGHNIDQKFGTVGAVAIDRGGNLASATSTGGLANKMFGRTGDSAIVGAGTYANNQTCAVSCTGMGEYFIRGVVAHDVSCLIEYRGCSLDSACHEVIHNRMKRLGGAGGLIAIDSSGKVCLSFNTEGMYRGWKNEQEEHTFIFSNDQA